MIPGVCFLVFFWRMMDSIDTGFRTLNNSAGTLLTSLALIVFSANLIIWILFDDLLLDAQKPDSPQSAEQNRLSLFVKNLLLFAVTTGVIFYFNQGTTFTVLYDNFVHSGAVYYGALILGDIAYMLTVVVNDIRKAQSLKTRIGWGVLFVYFTFLAVVIQYTVLKILDFEGALSQKIVSVAIPYLFAAFHRFRGHKKV